MGFCLIYYMFKYSLNESKIFIYWYIIYLKFL